MDEEIKEILKDIKEGIRYQSRLLESLLEVVDQKRHDSEANEKVVQDQLEKFKSTIFNIPGLKTNPEAAATLNHLFSSLGGK